MGTFKLGLPHGPPNAQQPLVGFERGFVANFS